MTSKIIVPGLTSDDKVPGFYPALQYGVGRKNIGALPVYVILLGNGDESAGTAAANTLYDVFSDTESKTLFGGGEELDRMCLAAMRIPGVNVKAMRVNKGTTPTAATLTVTIGGTWTTAGQFAIRLGGKSYVVGVSASDSTTVVAASLDTKLKEDNRLFCSSAAVAAVTTLTVKSAGPRGNDWVAYVDMTGAPTGLTVTLGGAGTSVTGGGKKFGSGATTDDVTAALAALLSEPAALYNYYAVAQNDATNAALVEAQLDTKAGPLVAQYEQAVYGHNGTQAAAISLAQTTLNHVLSQVVHIEGCESHPCEIAATVAALRAFYEQLNPNTNYDDVELPGIAPRAKESRSLEPNHSALKARLNAGLTPCVTVDGKVKIVRAITTKCLTGATPDYSTLDVSEATVPLRMSREIGATWAAFKADNPYAGPDSDLEGGEAPATSGTATPSTWNAQLMPVLRRAEKSNWITDVDGNLPTNEWDTDGERIMSAVPLKVKAQDHQLGVLLRQQA